MPVYVVDEEIYAKCPTVVISTVDKFARLPWTEETGLLFGKTNKKCERCGYIATGSDRHPEKSHEADRYYKLGKASVKDCKPFYPPELIIQDELHLITGPLGTIYGGFEKGVALLLKATLPTCAPNRHGLSLLQHAPKPSPAARGLYYPITIISF